MSEEKGGSGMPQHAASVGGRLAGRRLGANELPFCSLAFRDRERDILDNRWAGRISNDEALKLLTELYLDWHQARTVMREDEEVS